MKEIILGVRGQNSGLPNSGAMTRLGTWGSCHAQGQYQFPDATMLLV